MLQGASVYSGDASVAKFNYQPRLSAAVRRVSVPPAASTLAVQLPVLSPRKAMSSSSSSADGGAATRLGDQREGGEVSAAEGDGRQPRSVNGSRPTKDRRPRTARAASPKKTATSTSNRLVSTDWTSTIASVITPRRHYHHHQPQQQQQQPQHQQQHRKKMEPSTLALVPSVGGSSAPQLAWSGLHHPAAVATTSPPAGASAAAAAAAPIFTALPAGAAGVLVPVSAARRCPPGRVQRHQQHVLVAEQPPAPCNHLYRGGPGLSTAGPRGPAAGWRYATAAPAVASPQPAEYLLFGPSSVLLLR